MINFKRLLEAANRKTLFYWQQQLLDVLSNAYDIAIEGSSLVINFHGREVGKFEPPETEDAIDLKPWAVTLHWHEAISKLLTTGYSAFVEEKKDNPKISIRRGSAELFWLTPPSVIDPIDFSNYFLVNGQFSLDGSNLKESFSELLKVYEFSRKVKNLISNQETHIQTNSQHWEMTVFAKDGGGVFTRYAVVKFKPSKYEIYTNKGHLDSRLNFIGSSVSEDKALDFVLKAVNSLKDTEV